MEAKSKPTFGGSPLKKSFAILACAAALVSAVPSGAAPAAPGNPQAAPGAMPDLVVGRDRLINSLEVRNRTFPANDCAIVEGCVGSSGTRRTIEFDTQIVNQGTADAVLGNPSQRPELYEFSACHGHFHMRDSLDYFLTRGGHDSGALYNAATGVFFLQNLNVGGSADATFQFGPVNPNLKAISGDWGEITAQLIGDGDTTIGLFDPATNAFFLRNSNDAGPANITFVFGVGGSGMIPIAGDWDGNGSDTVGLYDPNSGTFFLRNANSAGAASTTFVFGGGGPNFVPIVGDWDGDDDDTIGLYEPTTGKFFLKNTNANGNADMEFQFGPTGLRPTVGDWNADGTDTVGVYSQTDGAFFARNSNAGGAADFAYNFGSGGVGFTPLAGDWDFDAGTPLPTFGYKQAFCWLDSQRVSGTNPSHYNCGNQGITAGWSDIYTKGLDCQWIDITGLAGGVYQLRVTVNDNPTLRIVQESNYTNNETRIKVRIAPVGGREEKAPTVKVTSPKRSDEFKVGEPINIKWKVDGGETVTHQEIWLFYSKKAPSDDPNNNHQAQALLINGNVAPGARSFTWTPTEDFIINGGQIVVRTHDATKLVGSEGKSKGWINILP